MNRLTVEVLAKQLGIHCGYFAPSIFRFDSEATNFDDMSKLSECVGPKEAMIWLRGFYKGRELNSQNINREIW